MSEFGGLFSENSLEGTLDFLNEKKRGGIDGVYKPSLKDAKDPSRGYRATLRLLPNLIKDENGKYSFGQSSIEKTSHYIRVSDNPSLQGMYDSPRNFGEPCELTTLYYALKNSNNAILMSKMEDIQYSRKYFCYVEIIEDEVQENVGKIMVWSFGKTIFDKIKSEELGDYGEPCNVFSLEKGKDFKLIITETGGEDRYPDYKKSAFVSNTSSVPVYNAEKGQFRNIPLTDDGKIHPDYQGKLVDFLMNREVELMDFAPKRLTDEQKAKIEEIKALKLGTSAGPSKASSNDLDFTSDDDFSEKTESFTFDDEEEDDFF